MYLDCRNTLNFTTCLDKEFFEKFLKLMKKLGSALQARHRILACAAVANSNREALVSGDKLETRVRGFRGGPAAPLLPRRGSGAGDGLAVRRCGDATRSRSRGGRRRRLLPRCESGGGVEQRSELPGVATDEQPTAAPPLDGLSGPMDGPRGPI